MRRLQPRVAVAFWAAHSVAAASAVAAAHWEAAGSAEAAGERRQRMWRAGASRGPPEAGAARGAARAREGGRAQGDGGAARVTGASSRSPGGLLLRHVRRPCGGGGRARAAWSRARRGGRVRRRARAPLRLESDLRGARTLGQPGGLGLAAYHSPRVQCPSASACASRARTHAPHSRTADRIRIRVQGRRSSLV